MSTSFFHRRVHFSAQLAQLAGAFTLKDLLDKPVGRHRHTQAQTGSGVFRPPCFCVHAFVSIACRLQNLPLLVDFHPWFPTHALAL